jgi:hypothetical protein
MPWRCLLLVLAIGCSGSGQYMVLLPGEQCPRATRLAFRSMTALGYRVTGVVEPSPVRAGRVDGVKRRADGTEARSRVRIECDAEGVRMQPVAEALLPSSDQLGEFGRTFKESVTTLAALPDREAESGAGALEVSMHRLGKPGLAGAGTLVRITVQNDTDRDVLVECDRIMLVTTGGDFTHAISGGALEAVVGSGRATAKVRGALLDRVRVPGRDTMQRYLVFPAGSYRNAQVSVKDVETGESDGFVVPLQ